VAAVGWFPSQTSGAWAGRGVKLKVSSVVCAVVGTELGSWPCEIRERPKRRLCPHPKRNDGSKNPQLLTRVNIQAAGC